MRQRIISLLLLAAMLLSLAACVGSTNSDNKDTTDSGTSSDTTEAVPGGIERCNYNNARFNIIAYDWGLYSNYFFTDENSGDAMDQAIYERELAVEEHLGIDLTYEFATSAVNLNNAVQTNVMTDEDNYQLVLTHCLTSLGSMLTGGYLYDFNDFEYINFDAEWWNHSANESLSTAGKQYYAISDYMIPDPNVILFNKQMVENLKLEDPYEVVLSGKWTIDKMMEMMSGVTTDNGDGNWDVNDTYGFGTPGDWYLISFLYSSGLTLMDKNEDGEFYLSIDSERTHTLFEKLDQLLNGPDTYIYPYKAESDTSLAAQNLNITKNRTLFGISTLNLMHLMRESTVEYGILPYPKLDETQENYVNNDWSGLMCVPKNVGNTEMVGKAIELLGYYSGDTTIPAYYDLVLGEKLSRDEGSKAMLDIIFDGIVFDAGFNYLGGEYASNMFWLTYVIPKRLVAEKQNNFASWLAQYSTGAQIEIDTFNQAISEME